MQEEYTIPQLVDDMRAGKLSRRQFTRKLALIGVSATGISAIVAAALRFSTTPHIIKAQEEEKHLQLHDQHLAHQTNGNTSALRNDYAEHAVVEDSLYDEPFVGRDAIMARKDTGFAAVTDAHIAVINRVVHENQVTVEWVATGKHTGDLAGIPATHRPYVLHGVTVVVRDEHGKIVREALYYDADDFRRQVS